MIVIADDITGAAEIAGIAFSQGEETRLLCDGSLCGDIIAAKGTTVVTTDTRSMSEAEAAEEMLRIGRPLRSLGETGGALFKKTDSALRGHVVAELAALMQATGYRRAVYLPANPSKGRIIRNGIYYIIENGTEKPLSETAFSYDPEFPASTSSLRERFPDAEERGMIMPDAESAADIHAVVNNYHDGHTLFAGAADLFTAWLRKGPALRPQPVPPLGEGFAWAEDCCSLLLVCGSTQSHPEAFGLPVSAMPLAIYEGSDDLTPWLDDALSKYAAGPLVLSIPHRHLTGKAVAVRLRRLMASLVGQLFQHHTPTHLYIEGGATAFAVLRALHISSLEVVAQPAPGVVSMRADDKFIVTLKPGSYAFRPLHGLAPSP
ncbi:MAG: four-carbon acid sugar kinase family protein [Prevotella sp.]|nr:four-carbon acid sugar kinase family protein [Prevotella sp.]